MPAAALRMGGVRLSLPLDLIAPRLRLTRETANERRPGDVAYILLVED